MLFFISINTVGLILFLIYCYTNFSSNYYCMAYLFPILCHSVRFYFRYVFFKQPIMEHFKKCSLIMYFSIDECNLLNMYCAYSYIWTYLYYLSFCFPLSFSHPHLPAFHWIHKIFTFPPLPLYWFESYRAKYSNYLVLVFLRKCFCLALKLDTDL